MCCRTNCIHLDSRTKAVNHGTKKIICTVVDKKPLQDNLHDRTEAVLNNKQPTQSEMKHFGLKKKLSLQSA